MSQLNNNETTVAEDTGETTGEEMDTFYNCDTRNRFDSRWEGQAEGQVERGDKNETNRRKNKRKRHSTGSVDINNFQSLKKDEQLSAIFSKLLNIEQSQHELHGLESAVNNNTERVRVVETQIDTNMRQIKMMTYRQIDTETKNKQNNLIFRGVKDVRNENVYETIENLFRTLLAIEPSDVTVMQIYRLGSFQKAVANATRFNDTPRRPILVQFQYSVEVESVMARVSRLRGTRYSVDRDYPTEIVMARKRIWADFKRLRSDNPRSSVTLKYPARVEVDGNTVLDQFPDWNDLLRERATFDFTSVSTTQRPKTSDRGRAYRSRSRPNAHDPYRSVYDRDTESEHEQTENAIRKQPLMSTRGQSANQEQDLPPSTSHGTTPPVQRTHTQSIINVHSSDIDDIDPSQSLLNPSKALESTNTLNPTVNDAEKQSTQIHVHNNTCVSETSVENPSEATNGSAASQQNSQSQNSQQNIDTGQSSPC